MLQMVLISVSLQCINKKLKKIIVKNIHIKIHIRKEAGLKKQIKN